MMGNDYDEINISQVPALEVLNNLGYKIIKQEDTERMRGSPYNVILKPILLDRLKTINSYEYLGNNYKFTEKNLLQAIQDINEPLTDGLIKTNEKIYDLLLLGKSYPEYIDYVGGTRSFNINYIDWNHPENNVFHAVEEYIVEKADGNGTIRPDIVLFVNGIPFAVIECKKSSISINQGISQMIRNQGQEYIPQLFKFVQIVLATNKNGTKYATVGTIPKFWNIWNEDEYSSEFDFFNNNLTQVVIDRIPTKQDENIVSLFHPKRVLDIIRYFILFDMHEKKIARYQQYFAVKEAIKVISEKDSNGKRKSGVIWHTQGSGKSLTMVMLAKYILYELSYLHPQVVVVTDRIELDSQIHKTFTHTRLKADRATSGKNLIELINGKSTDVITTLVNKFDMASRTQEPILSNDVFIMVDESHRTQYGEIPFSS